MKNAFKLELHKALKNKYFLASVLAGCILGIISAFVRIQMYDNNMGMIRTIRSSGVQYNSRPEVYTLYNNWLSADGYSVAYSLFYFLFPLFAAMPYAWSYCMERNKKYEHNLLIRTGKLRYYISKYLAVFLSGGLAVMLPLLLNFLIVAMAIPTRTPALNYEMYYGVEHGTMWSQLFYTAPMLYDVLYFLLNFLFCGLLAVLGMATAYFTRNQIAVLLVPFFVSLVLEYATVIFDWTGTGMALSPLSFLHATPLHNYNVWWVILLEGILLFLLSSVTTVIRGKYHEIY